MAADVAAAEVPEPSTLNPPSAVDRPLVGSVEKPLTTYLGVSFAVFLGLLPREALSCISCLRARNRMLSLKLLQADEQLRQMRSRRQEDSKANARVVEIFASHRNAWQQQERRLMAQIDAAAEEIATLRKKVEEVETAEAELLSTTDRLRLAVSERDEVIDFMSRKIEDGCGYEDDFAVEVEIGAYGNDLGGDFNGDYEDGQGDLVECASEFSAGRASEGRSPVPEVCYDGNGNFEEVSSEYSEKNVLGRDILSASKAWKERSDDFTSFEGILNRGLSAEPDYDFQYESLASPYPAKHYYVARRESPWKVDCNSTGVSAKLKLLENELVNLERLGSGELSRVPSLMRKQAKRYQSLAGKIDDLCRRMQVSDPSEPTLRPEFRAQRQTEFLLEASHLQHRASEIRQKLTSLQSEAAKTTAVADDPCLETKLNTRRSSDSIRINFEEIQRNLEIWLARITGDLEGILATSGVSHVRECSITRT